ncbi:MAG: hypothetical protein P8Z67_14365, partial [Gammaproteobacteria bacterium]
EVQTPGPLSGGAGMGFLMRFTGHLIGGHRNWPFAQPKWGYQPFGGLGWLRWLSGAGGSPTVQFYHGDFDVAENFGGAKAVDTGNACHDNDIPSGKHRTGGAMAKLVDHFIDSDRATGATSRIKTVSDDQG